MKLTEKQWKVSNEEYYAEDTTNITFSYSLLAKYVRGGFGAIPTLFEPTPKTEALIFGSAVDCLLTDGEDAYNNEFVVFSMPNISEKAKQIVDEMLRCDIDMVSENDEDVMALLSTFGYYPNYKPETRIRKFYEEALQYHMLCKQAKGKTIINPDTDEKVKAMVESLKNSPTTKEYFAEPVPFENVEKVYQPMFRCNILNMEFKIMIDLLIINHDKKTIQICDLKTSSKPTWKFDDSYWDWSYFIQSHLYTIVIDELKKDTIEKDYKILPFKFIVASKKAGEPCVWVDDIEERDIEEKYKDTMSAGDRYILSNPVRIAYNLSVTLKKECSMPYYFDNKPHSIKRGKFHF